VTGVSVSARALKPGVVLLEDNKGSVLVDDVISVHISDTGNMLPSLRFEVWAQLRHNNRVHLGSYGTAEKAEAAADHFVACCTTAKRYPESRVRWVSPNRWRTPQHTVTLVDGTVLDVDCIENVKVSDYGTGRAAAWQVEVVLSADPDRLLQRRGQVLGRFGANERAAHTAIEGINTAIETAKSGVNVTVDTNLCVIDTAGDDT